jgi:predicted esterase
MIRVAGLCVLMSFCVSNELTGQVDTTFIYRSGVPYGTLDIRLAKSSTRYYYLQQNRTFAFRESSPGVRTYSYKDMTSWDSSPYTQGNLREKNGSADYFVMNYRLLEPLNYNKTYQPGYPLIVFMHGAGERGNCWRSTCYFADPTWNPNTNSPPAPTDPDSKVLNNDHNLLHGGSTHLAMRNSANGKLPNDPTLSARSFPGFVLFAQTLNGWTGSTVQDLIRLVRLVAKKYNIDEDRIYIEGLSAGGTAQYEAIKRAPWLFASSIAMSSVSDAGIISLNYQSKIAHIPLWIFQGGIDTNPSPSQTLGYVKKFRDAGMLVRYTVYPELGHGTWNKAMNEPDFFKWMLTQTKARIHTFAGSTSICGTNGQGVKMQLSEGFRAYQWERNGVIISGANSAFYTASTAGTYRARFSRKLNPGSSDWNEWSPSVSITISTPSAPVVDQIGTVILKDLNGFGDAKLFSITKADKYYWYKNGTRIALADTVSEPTFKSGSCTTTSCPGNGAYTLVTSNLSNCPSPPSKPKYVYFNNTAPLNITAPASFTGSAQSGGTAKLTWSNSSANETGFEIWRRKVLSSTTFTKWEMRVLTIANVTSFTDSKLDPSSTYHYKIRAVSNSGRSNYTPSASNAYLVIKTSVDTSPPTAPKNLTAQATAINTVKLSWTASTDNSGIRQYRIYYGSKTILTGDNKTSHTITGLTLNSTYSFTVRAEDLGGNLSANSNTATANTYVTGLYYEHSTGAWTDLDNINWTAPAEFTGKVTTFTLAPRTQEDFFNFEFDGYLFINTAGVYYFQTISSDGSRLTLDGAVIVENDGVHASRSITSAARSLTGGPKRINIKYFEYDETHVLNVRYKGPDTGNNFVTIPATALKSGNAPSSAAIASTEETELMKTVGADIYPNPTTPEDINVQMEVIDTSPVSIHIVDFTGREIYNKVFSADEVSQGVRIDPDQNMIDGIYLLITRQNGTVLKERLSIKN